MRERLVPDPHDPLWEVMTLRFELTATGKKLVPKELQCRRHPKENVCGRSWNGFGSFGGDEFDFEAVGIHQVGNVIFRTTSVWVLLCK